MPDHTDNVFRCFGARSMPAGHPPDLPDKTSANQKQQHNRYGSCSEESTDDDSEYSSVDEEHKSIFDDAQRSRTTQASRTLDRADWTIGKVESHDNKQTGATTLLGLDEDGLVSLLAPDRTWNKRKFELSINDLTFVGRPIFAKQNGSWRRAKSSRPKRQRSVSPTAQESTEDDSAISAGENEGQEPQSKAQQVSDDTKSALTMFHIVFVMSPPQLDHTFRVKEMYENVVKKLSKAMKWVQTRHDYVKIEAENLLAKRQQLLTTKEQPPEKVMAEVTEISALAKALVNVFNAISASKIASVTFLPGVSISLQIPPVTSTAYLPSLAETPIPPGMWLTTATEAAPNEDAVDKHSASSTTVQQLAKSYTLLLKSPPNKIARDAQLAGGPLASHLPKFVAALKPTKSFWKLSHSAQIPLADIQLLARHLIYWRRAIAIPPLHQRDTYIVSPNADFRKLRDACKSYDAQFPAPMRSLPNLLALLGNAPKPFRDLIPSDDHKETYMFVLAWLMRNGWVTQLRTFAYVRASSDVKQQARERERESRASISQSFNSTRATVEPRSGDVGDPSRPSFVSRQSSDGRSSVRESKLSEKVASLIKSPARASPEESGWLTSIQDSMLNGTDSFAHLHEDDRYELYRYWPILSKYFDGSTALESVPVREGLKRVPTWDLYSKLGLRFDGKVEDSEGRNQSIILTIRHW